ncbi:hypothetical protein D3C79_805580 [compost metagenome]
MALPLADSHFVAVKRLFPEARERLPYTPQLQAWLISAEHRLFHQLWHATRDKWHRLSEEKHGALRGLGWQPGPRDKERDARGPRKHRNGSGVDAVPVETDPRGVRLGAGNEPARLAAHVLGLGAARSGQRRAGAFCP